MALANQSALKSLHVPVAGAAHAGFALEQRDAVEALARGGEACGRAWPVLLHSTSAADRAARAGIGIRPGSGCAAELLDVGGRHGIADRRLVGNAVRIGRAGRKPASLLVRIGRSTSAFSQAEAAGAARGKRRARPSAIAALALADSDERSIDCWQKLARRATIGNLPGTSRQLLRKTMSETELTTGDFTEAAEPFRLFGAWLDDATKSEPNDPNGVALATVDADGMPDVRMVLLKGFDEAGLSSTRISRAPRAAKSLARMKAAMCFHWKSLRRQVRDARAGRGRQRRRGRRLLRDAAARQPHRRLGVETVAAAGKPLRAGEGGRRIHARATRSARFRGRSTGRVSASCRRRSSSGTTARSACTTASSFRAMPQAAGTRRGCIRKARRRPGSSLLPGHERRQRGARFVRLQPLAEMFAFLTDAGDELLARAAHQVARDLQRLAAAWRRSGSAASSTAASSSSSSTTS